MRPTFKQLRPARHLSRSFAEVSTPLPSLAPAAVVGAMNVVRAYLIEHITQAHRALTAPLADPGQALPPTASLKARVSLWAAGGLFG